jgi:hypothetical protein
MKPARRSEDAMSILTSDRTIDSVRATLQQLDWQDISRRLDEQGFATTPPLLAPLQCRQLIELYSNEGSFRSRIDMARYRFGEGEYKYLAEPLPDLVQSLRREAYPNLAPVANRWAERLRTRENYPDDLDSFQGICHKHGQHKPTPLILYYRPGGYNCMHQDLYGEIAFPLQMTCVLSQVGEDFTGGELLLVEQRPRAQSRGTTIALQQGEAVIFPNRYRPIPSARGYYRANIRHGVSTVTSGERYSLGIIFHDAK